MDLDVNGWLMGPEFLAALATLVSTLLTSFVMGILNPLFGSTA